MKLKPQILFTACLLSLFFLTGCATDKAAPHPQVACELSDAEVENLVQRSYHYVAMNNVNKQFALKQGGWNTMVVDRELKGHTMREIARPNNDRVCISCLLDLRHDPVILEMPAFDSKYVSPMITAYDHYVKIPMSTRLGDFRKSAERIAVAERAKRNDPKTRKDLARLFQLKGQMTLELLLLQSVIGPIGVPAAEALYPLIVTTDSKPMNAMNNYVIRMSAKDWPSSQAFRSVTLYDTKNCFFIPNDRKKYSVGENAGMKLDEDEGIAIHIAAQKPEGIPEGNWLPITRQDEDIGAIMRICVPDLEKMKSWTPPKAEKVGSM